MIVFYQNKIQRWKGEQILDHLLRNKDWSIRKTGNGIYVSFNNETINAYSFSKVIALVITKLKSNGEKIDEILFFNNRYQAIDGLFEAYENALRNRDEQKAKIYKREICKFLY